MTRFDFPAPSRSEAEEALRAEVRSFLATELTNARAIDRAPSWSGFDASFSRKLGARGWIGMTWPRRYGGREASFLERYVVLEELLAAGAPVAAHWIADRQSGPLLLRYGTEAQREAILPRIAAGECFFCIGMSEPDSGSDLAATRTRARPVEGGWRVSGAKLWTTYAHKSHYMILFCRTSDEGERNKGLSQFLVEMTTPGVTVRPVCDISGAHHFNEVHFDDVFLPADTLLGTPGQGWAQVMNELAFERSGPERFLSSFTLMDEFSKVVRAEPTSGGTEAVGRFVAHLVTLRRLSRSVATRLQAGADPTLEAALVKDLGALLEQDTPEIVRRHVAAEPSAEAPDDFAQALAWTIQNAPAFSLRGGTREILRGIIARGLGLR
ncbi:MAG: acyl-CoA dehydrogenase [Rhodospirillales bacterium SCN 65-16]|jgi:alkylation response protein AidB-like acyl-CoA dehydrogenase|uniref:acyl-CoA dehydrogenase family protein n=1 Tax=Bosea sp. (in: a-proteobacteria) TaxID=1871050 RepID=UPI00086F336D|nr:acyl-CoA dehydrogenase family protein [Bosea sp. (in: a-proteobacteria)]MBN9469364.1 acyl-CoA dehydrogenase family protein [Bosea sp. (in: a-proteobacteria)]ODT99134.1 MAG: acyl-CoA dehydrogenase [Rhodospirillales bacterium SCN 65-16]